MKDYQVGNIDKIYEIVQPLLGMKAPQVECGYANGVTIEFGNLIRSKRGHIRGEWGLFITYNPWRLETIENVIVSSHDKEPFPQEGIKKIIDQPLTNIDIKLPSLDTTFTFGENFLLQVFNIYTKGDQLNDAWILFFPENQALSVGPGNKWSVGNASKG